MSGRALVALAAAFAPVTGDEVIGWALFGALGFSLGVVVGVRVAWRIRRPRPPTSMRIPRDLRTPRDD